MPAKFNFMNHVRWLRAAARAVDADVLVALESMAAYVRRGPHNWTLQPQFMIRVEGALRYTVEPPEDEAMVFVGWRPSAVRTWPATQDKLLFKKLAQQAGLPVPPFAVHENLARQLGDVVVKRRVGSFGEQVHGPFRTAAIRPVSAADGDYHERFIPGTMLKIWYLDERAVAVERDTISAVDGDGRSTVRELVEQRLARRVATLSGSRDQLMQRVAHFAEFEGRHLDQVLAPGERQQIEFRFGSDLGAAITPANVADPSTDDPAWQSVRDAGRVFHAMIPPALRDCVLYAIDAVQDEQGTIWYLEMNSNPVVQPLAYAAMLERLVAGTPPPRAPMAGTAP